MHKKFQANPWRIDWVMAVLLPEPNKLCFLCLANSCEKYNKYQFICQMYIFFFSLTSKLTFQKPTEILLLFLPRNARRIPPLIFSTMSNPARVKSSMNHKALLVMHMDSPHTARPNFAILSHFEWFSAINLSLSLKTSPSSGFSRCCMWKWKCHPPTQFHEMSTLLAPGAVSLGKTHL